MLSGVFRQFLHIGKIQLDLSWIIKWYKSFLKDIHIQNRIHHTLKNTYPRPPPLTDAGPDVDFHWMFGPRIMKYIYTNNHYINNNYIIYYCYELF